MNPGSFFREVLESHEFRSSDNEGPIATSELDFSVFSDMPLSIFIHVR